MQTSVDDITEALLSASTALVAVAARSLSSVATDVTLPQFRGLVVLAMRGPIGMTDLAEELACSPSTATRLCDRLVRKGLMARATGSTNRREIQVRLTGRGAAVVSDVREGRRREIARIVRAVPASERRHMVDALNAFAEAASVSGHTIAQAWSSGWNS